MPQEDNETPTDEHLSDRLDRLKGRLGDYNQTKSQDPDVKHDSPESKHQRASLAQAFRLSSEFIAGVVVGAGIGYGIDAFFGTSPWGFIIFFLLGFLTAILNVLRAAGMVAESEMRLKPAYEMKKDSADRQSGDAEKK